MALLLLVTGCTSGKLFVPSVRYQAVRTEFAQPDKVPDEAKIAATFFINTDGVLRVVVKNLTDEVMMIDQTKSFCIMPSGTSVSYFDPTITVNKSGTMNSATSSSSFNLGAITSAFGLGGTVAGSLLNGTTVGSSSTGGIYNESSVTIADQPIVKIGPHGQIVMSKDFQISGIGMKSFELSSSLIDVKESASICNFSTCITFSIDDGETYDKLVTKFYLSSDISQTVYNKRVGDAFSRIYSIKPDALAENMYLFLIPNNIEKNGTDVLSEFIIHTAVFDSYVNGALVDYK